MTDLKLAKLPDRTPVKISITVTPELNKALQAYADYPNSGHVSPAEISRRRADSHQVRPGETLFAGIAP